MNWWGKLIGTGIGMFGGPIGALAEQLWVIYTMRMTLPPKTNERPAFST